jgi:Holliday junction resolvase RusA-like endonuclease
VPPTYWEEIRKGQRVPQEASIFSHARERIGNIGGHGKAYPPTKNIAEQANILETFLTITGNLDIQHHLPWGRGKTGIMLLGHEIPKPATYWEGKPHTAKPDPDNMLKQFCDALNPNPRTGFVGAWPDDSWTIPLYADKIWSEYAGVHCTIIWFEDPLVVRPAKPRKKKPDGQA